MRYRALERAEALALSEAVLETREELKRRFRWAAKSVDEAAEALFIENAREAVGIFDEKGSLVGVASVKTGADAPGLAELSLWIRRSRQDKGAGTRVAKDMVARAFKAKAHKVWARVDPGNRAGRRVLKKLGFKFEGCLRRERRLNGRWADLECWGLLKEDRS